MKVASHADFVTEPDAVRANRVEARRLEALREYQVLDTGPEESFDRITRLARATLHFPVALVSLVDRDRQFFKSNTGLEGTRETPRDISFCTYTIHEDDPLVIPDSHLDARFASNPLVVGPPFIRSYWGAPLTSASGYNVGSLCVIDREPRAATADQLGILKDLAGLVVDQMECRLMAGTDFLTGAKTRREFVAQANRLLQGAVAAGGAPIACVLVDVDHFKHVNDRYGHAVGDDVLRHVIRVLIEGLPPGTLIGRLGGEEFAIILPGEEAGIAHATAERLRGRLVDSHGSVPGLPNVTASFGVASIHAGDVPIQTLINRADHALYEAKAAGRNCVRDDSFQPV